MQVLRLIMALMLAVAVPVAALAGAVDAHDCGARVMDVNAHHDNMPGMDHDDEPAANCDGSCDCPAFQCSTTNFAFNEIVPCADPALESSCLKPLAATSRLAGHYDPPYRPPNTD